MSPSLIFAQAGGGGPPEAFFAFLVMFICGLAIVMLLPTVFFLLTLQRALARCHPQNRTMEPGMVWLALIPLFNIVWEFIIVLRMSESLRNEFRDRGWHRRGDDYGHGIGMAFCGLAVASIIPYCGSLFGIAAFVCWIIYWVKIAGYSGQLLSQYDDYDDRRDDYDRAPRARDRDHDRDDYDDRSDNRRSRDDRFDEDDRPTRRRDEHDDYHDDRGDDRKPWDRDGR
ncbi:Uncharacterized protein OS=Tolypothrix bouteillei VB521301 GN=DA73_000000134230 PE=4 SV=1 [Gemmata massiliana]|uniref:DUF4328 domain-containing protein n=1 Tax=Gemmata massiliana TaxID=1210884 RepID=A0A6P2CXF1_9BACT|nr:hypothetical protein [Gemmata massiliana]VTR93056.1 Uncharacterized protein OS=Tolypothrix bouteillei VB521301 GN=DA73_000000134230 PE=4 SV=1 [Gemmata massiliana]